MTRKLPALVAICSLFASFAVTVNCVADEFIDIVSYDIQDAAVSGFGGWNHFYDGTITITGSDDANGFGFDRADYTGGSGTLNDGLLGTDEDDTQLIAQTDTGTMPFLSFNLDNSYQINSINLDSFGGNSNSIPGTIAGFDITINGNTVSFLSTEDGSNGEFVDLTGSGLENLTTDQVTISNFVHDGTNGLNELFSISEVRIKGVKIPEPTSATICMIAGAIGLMRRRR